MANFIIIYVQPLLSVLDTASESHTPGGPGKESATDSRVHGLKDAMSTGMDMLILDAHIY